MADAQRANHPAIGRPTAVERATSPTMLFFRQFLASPKAVGAIIATSQAVVDRLLDPVDWNRCRTIVEYGPGTGVFTRDILRRGRADLRVVAIDPNQSFIDHLLRTLPDPRLSAVRGSAEAVEDILAHLGTGPADHILSGLPFSTLPPGLGERIVAATRCALAPGGDFLVYQYSLFVKPWLDLHFDRVEIGREWRCIPPCRILRAVREQ